MVWTVEFYKDENGRSPVEEFLDGIENTKLRAKVLRDIELLATHGTALREPFAVHVENGVWELRTKQSSNIARTFYFIFANNKIILLHGMVKKKQKADRSDILQAEKRKEDYVRRNKL